MEERTEKLHTKMTLGPYIPEKARNRNFAREAANWQFASERMVNLAR
jgi:hypothetical protein